jgi:hypothetical protein
MGVVWAGRDEALGRDVAIKEVIPPPDLSAEDRDVLRRRTLREARAAARISSRAAVSVYDVVEEDGRPWIVMQTPAVNLGLLWIFVVAGFECMAKLPPVVAGAGVGVFRSAGQAGSVVLVLMWRLGS